MPNTKKDVVITLKYSTALPKVGGFKTLTGEVIESSSTSFKVIVRAILRKKMWVSIPPTECWIGEDVVVSRSYVTHQGEQFKLSGELSGASFLPAWYEAMTPERFKEQFPLAINFEGPGWYLTRQDSLLVLPIANSDQYMFCVYNRPGANRQFTDLSLLPVHDSR